MLPGSEVTGYERANSEPRRLLCLLSWNVINYGSANNGNREKRLTGGKEEVGLLQSRNDLALSNDRPDRFVGESPAPDDAPLFVTACSR